MDRPSSRFIIIGTIKYALLIFANYICFFAIDKLNVINIFDKDLLPYVDKNSMIAVMSGTLIMLTPFVLKKDITILNIFIKRYETSLKVVLFFIGIIIWKRCDGEGHFYLMYVLIMYVYYMTIEYGGTRTFRYDICVDSIAPNCYEERPIIGRKLLTNPQIDVLNQLHHILKNRTSFESVNIALVGNWGKGKTSVIETLIYELENHKENNEEYFILKIDMGILKKPVNVVEYVNNYFYILFRQYGIISLGSVGGLAYFSSFKKLLEETNMSVLSKLFFTQNEKYFSDLEGERKLFSKKVKKLLDVSGKKNILLIIDDADRVEREHEVSHLLSEFSGINGVISIMLLNKSIRGLIRPNSQMGIAQSNVNNDIDKDSINKYGKYVHLEISIEDVEKIEYEEAIKEQIVAANDSVKNDDIYYVSYINGAEKRSIFDSIRDYGTNRLAIDGHVVYGECNLLTELFNDELKVSNDLFGVFLEKKVKEYFLSCKEFEQLTKHEYDKYMEITIFSSLSFMFGIDDFFDWVGQIGGTFNQFFGELSMIMEAIKMIEECPIDDRPDICRLDDIRSYFMKRIFFNSNSEKELDNTVSYDSNFIVFKHLLFSPKDERDIIQLLNNGDFNQLNTLMEKKIEKIINLNVLGITILEFMHYVRDTMNNYRHFKMQIRESNLLNIFYLDYLLKNWHVNNSKKEEFIDMKNHYVWMQNIQPEWPYLQAFFNTIMYEKFINANGKCLEEKNLNDIKASLLRGFNRKVLVLTGRDSNNKIIYRAVSIEENKKCHLDDNEMAMLKAKVRKLYYEYVNEDTSLELAEI